MRCLDVVCAVIDILCIGGWTIIYTINTINIVELSSTTMRDGARLFKRRCLLFFFPGPKTKIYISSAYRTPTPIIDRSMDARGLRVQNHSNDTSLSRVRKLQAQLINGGTTFRRWLLLAFIAYIIQGTRHLVYVCVECKNRRCETATHKQRPIVTATSQQVAYCAKKLIWHLRVHMLSVS